MRWRRAIVGLLVGLAFGLVYFFFSFGAAGAGHGTFIFFAALSPYGLGVLAFPALGFLAGDLRPFLSKVIFISLLVIHYTLAIFTLRIPWIRDPAYIDKTWDFSRSYVVVPAALYIGGNVLLWTMFVYNLIHYRKDATEQIVGRERR